MVTIWKGIENFTNFLWSWLNSGGELVDQSVANSRAATCVPCHNNVNVDQAVKVGCCGRGANAAMNEFRKRIIQTRTTPSDTHLKACDLCGCDLKTKVWVPIDVVGITKEDSNAFPEFCWIKQELENI